MFEALLRRKERATQDTEYLFGQLASTFVNYSMAAPKAAVAPAEFMPSEILKRIARKRKGPTKEERQAIDAQARAIFRAITEARSKEGS